jgi:hypothetical protein
MTRKRREARQTELKFVSDFVARYYPGRRVWTNLRIGAPHPSLVTPDMTPEEIRLTIGWKRRCDAVVALDDRLVLIEGMIEADPYHVARLEHYSALLPHTPELEAYKHLPIEKVLVFPIEDPIITAMCRKFGTRAVLHQPPWLSETITTFPWRLQRGSKTWPEL